jgi:CRISPR/Cas system-associated endoribonuclease Cas2
MSYKISSEKSSSTSEERWHQVVYLYAGKGKSPKKNHGLNKPRSDEPQPEQYKKNLKPASPIRGEPTAPSSDIGIAGKRLEPLDIQEYASPVFKSWLNSDQGSRLRTLLGADYRQFIADFARNVPPAQQLFLVLYMQGVVSSPEKIAALVNLRFPVVLGMEPIDAGQVQRATYGKSLLTSALIQSGGGRFANLKNMRELVGYGFTSSFTVFLQSSRATAVKRVLGEEEFSRFCENVAKRLNPVEQAVLVFYLSNKLSSQQIAQKVNERFGLTGTQSEMGLVSVNKLVGSRGSSISQALFGGGQSLSGVLPKQTLMPVEIEKLNPEFQKFLSSERGSLFRQLISVNTSSESLKEFLSKSVPQRQQLMLALYLGTGFSRSQIAAHINTKIPPTGGEKAITEQNVRDWIGNKGGALGQTRLFIDKVKTFAQWRDDLKAQTPGVKFDSIPSTGQRVSLERENGSNVQNSPRKPDGLQVDLYDWLTKDERGRMLGIFTTPNFEFNSRRIKEHLTEPQQYALFLYLSEGHSLEDLQIAVEIRFGSATKAGVGHSKRQITIKSLEEDVLDFALKVNPSAKGLRSVNGSMSLLTANSIVRESFRQREAQSIEKSDAKHLQRSSFETILSRQDRMLIGRLKSVLGGSTESFLLMVSRDISPIKQHILGLILDNKLTSQMCATETNRRFNLHGTNQAMTSNNVIAVLSDRSELSKRIEQFSNGKYRSINELRRAMY